MTNIATAQREYFRRPADERYPTVQAMIDAADYQKAHSVDKQINAKDLHAAPHGQEVALVGPSGNPARLTHWAFGQLARSIGAPASYLRELPPQLAADCLNHGLQETPPATDLRLLIQAPNGRPEPTIRACTSESYGRVYDADLYNQISRALMQNGKFSLPPTWDGQPAGAYRSDRDSFLIVVNGGSIVQDPSLANSVYRQPQPASVAPGNQANDAGSMDGMYRGLLVRNSEVGAASITIDQILFRFICGNHMLWGAIVDKTFKRRHIGKDSALRDTIREINQIAFHWTNTSASRDEAIIRSLIEHEIARSKESVVDELQKIGFSKKDATTAYDTCEQLEPASPRSFWGIAQGATRASQRQNAGADAYQDQRYALDQLAAKVLQKGVKQYATV